jgi:hypothetical protein
MELDPVSPAVSLALGRALGLAGRIEEGIEQVRATTRIAPGWTAGWSDLSRVLFEVEEYDEGLEAWVTWLRLRGSEVRDPREAYQAAIRYRETGEPQTFSDPTMMLNFIWLYDRIGQPDRVIGLFQDLVRPGAYGLAAYAHVYYATDLVRADPRYQALLEQAGITW